MLKSKIFHHEDICNFDFNYFLIKCTAFVLIGKNGIKNQKFNFPVKLREIRKNVKKKNCSSRRNLQF